MGLRCVDINLSHGYIHVGACPVINGYARACHPAVIVGCALLQDSLPHPVPVIPSPPPMHLFSSDAKMR